MPVIRRGELLHKRARHIGCFPGQLMPGPAASYESRDEADGEKYESRALNMKSLRGGRSENVTNEQIKDADAEGSHNNGRNHLEELSS